ncbi:MAG: TonB family protein [Acidobacteriota bacterium]
MSLILVVEQEGRYIERIHDALTAEGWRVKVVNGREPALQAAASEAPALVLVNSDLPDAVPLLDQFSRHRGGPGTVALVPERSVGRITAQELGADDILGKPFSDQDLRLLVRRSLNAQREVRPATSLPAGKQLTSEDIFGDVLAEMETEPAPVRPPSSATRDADLIQKKLEQTLAGLSLPQVKAPAPKPAPRPAAGIDKLISDTLSGFDAGTKRPATAKPASPAPLPAAPLSPSPPPPAPPIAAQPEVVPAPIAPPPISPSPPAPPVSPPAPPPLVVPSAVPTPPRAMAAGGEAAKAKRTGEIDLSQLDELARPRTRTGSVSKPASAAPAPAAKPAAPAEDMARTQRLPTFGAVPESREFGQYTLLDRIAVGGMAEVWKARMKGVEGFQKTVAIKRILPSLTDSPDFVTMFIDEAKLAAQLQHNNIIHIYDLGKLGEDFYIAMEYIEGKDLRTILNTARSRQMALPQELALLVASRLASALDYAHRKRDFDNRELGLVHRDVSPQNVLISYEGDIKLCDFGIVKAVSKSSKTQMGALKGKLQYMSPEQAWGKPVDARSDIFSLGSLLFEMLTGRRLFAGDSEISVLESVRDCRVERPQAIDPAIPGEIDALVMKALEREPENRFPSAGAMQKEIERVLQSQRRSPSPADLAGYMHRLFSGEARAQEAGAGAAASGAAASWTGVGSLPSPAALSSTGSQVKPIAAPAGATGVQRLEGEAKGRTMLWLAIAAAVLLGIGLYYFLGRAKTPAAPPTEVPPSAAATTEATAMGVAAPSSATLPGTDATNSTTAATATATPNLGQRVDQAVAQREAQLKSDFEAEKKRLADQIEKAKATPPAKTPPAPAVDTAKAEQERLTAEKAEQDRLAAEKGEQDRLVAEKAEADRKAEEQAAAAAVAAAKPAAPAAPTVQLGDLVQSGTPGVVPPSLVSRPQPSYPAIAKQMRVEGDVIVEVLVDETGAIRDSRVVKSVPQLDSAALSAARSAKFRPATKDGVRVKMLFRLNFPFRL